MTVFSRPNLAITPTIDVIDSVRKYKPAPLAPIMRPTTRVNKNARPAPKTFKLIAIPIDLMRSDMWILYDFLFANNLISGI